MIAAQKNTHPNHIVASLRVNPCYCLFILSCSVAPALGLHLAHQTLLYIYMLQTRLRLHDGILPSSRATVLPTVQKGWGSAFKMGSSHCFGFHTRKLKFFSHCLHGLWPLYSLACWLFVSSCSSHSTLSLLIQLIRTIISSFNSSSPSAFFPQAVRSLERLFNSLSWVRCLAWLNLFNTLKCLVKLITKRGAASTSPGFSWSSCFVIFFLFISINAFLRAFRSN